MHFATARPTFPPHLASSGSIFARLPSVNLPDGVSAEDIRTAETARTLLGPQPPQNPLARLMTSAKGALVDSVADFDFQSRDRNQRLAHVRLKSRRNRELRDLSIALSSA